MLTIVITNRNRDLITVERTLRSIVHQDPSRIKVVVVDYGSEIAYQGKLQQLVEEIGDCSLILCPTQGQLWQKTRAINIALKQCETPFFMVADMDMIFHPQFVEKAMALTTSDVSYYFQVGILTEEESKLQKHFYDYKIKFKTNKGATGITLFPTQSLKEINGFDEFYHGWGAEDTDVHVRLKNAGHTVSYYDKECLFLHQWHSKHYRTEDSLEPFHPLLEKINQQYLLLTKTSKKMQANTQTSWGVMPNQQHYSQLAQPLSQLTIFATQEAIEAFCFQLREGFLQGAVQVTITPHPKAKKAKQKLKKVLKKKTARFLKMKEANEMVLSTIISYVRNSPYRYEFDRKAKKISLFINVSPQS